MNLLARSNTEAVDDFRSNITFNCEKGEKGAKIRLTLVMSGDVVERSTNLIVVNQFGTIVMTFLSLNLFKMYFGPKYSKCSLIKTCYKSRGKKIVLKRIEVEFKMFR